MCSSDLYPKNSVKAMMSIWGTGQLSLTKCIITVPRFVDTRNIIEVFGYLGENFDPQKDLTLIQTTPLDTLDFTSGKLHVGSKVGLNCIGDGKRLSKESFDSPKEVDPRNKVKFINEDLKILEFDYLGNSSQDLPIWEYTKKILYTNISKDLRKVINSSKLAKYEVKAEFSK